MFHSIFHVKYLTVIFNRIVQKNYPLTRVSNSTFGCIVEEIGGICGTHGTYEFTKRSLPVIPKAKAPLGGNM